jgi:Phospholipid-binding protein
MASSEMKLEVLSFPNGSPIPGEFAFCIPGEKGHVALGTNRSPHLRWSNVPEGTKSLAIVVHDPDVPSKPDDVNKEGRTVPHDLPRVDFYHWVLVDIPPTLKELRAGIDSDGVTAGGKELGKESTVCAVATTIRLGFRGTRIWEESMAATTVRALRGMTSVCTIIISHSMLWTYPRWVSAEASAVPTP